MAKNIGLKLKPMSVRVTFVAFALFLLFAALSSFGVLTGVLDRSFDLILGVAAALVIFTEVGLSQVWKSRGKDVDILGLIGIIAGVTVLITIVLEFVNITTLSSILNPIQGFIFGVLVVSFFVEAFR